MPNTTEPHQWVRRGGPVRSPDGPAKNRTHQRLLQSAVQLFAARGFHGTGIRDLAAASQISTATLYHYMGTKERLLFQIMHDALQRFILAAQTIENNAPDARVRLASLVRLHVITHALHQDVSVVVDNELDSLEPTQREIIVSQRDAYEKFWADAIAQGVEDDSFSVSDQRLTRIALLEICSGVARWYSPEGEYSLDKVADLHVDLARGLLNVPKEPPEWSFPQQHVNVHALVEDIWAIHVPKLRGSRTSK